MHSSIPLFRSEIIQHGSGKAESAGFWFSLYAQAGVQATEDGRRENRAINKKKRYVLADSAIPLRRRWRSHDIHLTGGGGFLTGADMPKRAIPRGFDEIDELLVFLA
jgi:hypothetical protein